jgi:glutathione S-transferase
VLVDGDFRVIESFAILDYLEARYPTPALMPAIPAAIAKVRMVEMVTAE